MGIAKSIAWALGLYESDEHYQKRLDKWNRKQEETINMDARGVLLGLEGNGYDAVVQRLERRNKNGGCNYNIPEFIKQVWATKPEIKEALTYREFETYYQKLEQTNNKDLSKDKELLDKEKELLGLKIRLAELETKNKVC